MISKVYSVLFLFVLGFGIWHHQVYVNQSKHELKAIEKQNNQEQTLFHANQFESTQYIEGIPTRVLSAEKGEINTSGLVQLEGRIKIATYEANELQNTIASELAFGELSSSDESASLLNSERELKHLTFPEKVTLKTQNGIIETRNVKYQVPVQRIETEEKVNYLGQGQTLYGKGMSYHLGLGVFEMGGPVKGEMIPAQNAKKKAEQK